MLIEAHEATIQTATVEIRTLTVTGKQVTLAVFRQLQEEPIEDHYGRLRGEPWGKVNYHPDKCADTKRHLHVVWQLGGELRRARVKPPDRPGEWFPVYPAKRWARAVEGEWEWLNAALLSGWRPKDVSTDTRGNSTVFVDFAGTTVGIDFDVAARKLVSAEGHLARILGSDRLDACERAEVHRREIAEAKAALAAPFTVTVPSLDQANAMIREELRQQDDEYVLRQANWDRFQNLPQLFVAV